MQEQLEPEKKDQTEVPAEIIPNNKSVKKPTDRTKQDNTIVAKVTSKDTAEKSIEIITSPAINHASIKSFSDTYVATEDAANADSLKVFEESFTAAPTAPPILSSYLIERDDGIADVKKKWFGMSICYTFDAGAEYATPSFYKCDHEVKFKFEMRQ